MFLMLSICASALGTVGLISRLLRKAPLGWQDEQGFHLIEEREETATGAFVIPVFRDELPSRPATRRVGAVAF